MEDGSVGVHPHPGKHQQRGAGERQGKGVTDHDKIHGIFQTEKSDHPDG